MLSRRSFIGCAAAAAAVGPSLAAAASPAADVDLAAPGADATAVFWSNGRFMLQQKTAEEILEDVRSCLRTIMERSPVPAFVIIPERPDA